jgi:hypothetical protein
METIEIHTRGERFTYGFAAGFYDALADDGARYLDEIRRYGAGDAEDLSAGYRAGRLARLGMLTPWPDPPPPSFDMAA